MTEATIKALDGLRDLTAIKWYIIPILVFVMYIYAREVKSAREKKNWDAIFAGLALFGMDFFNETWNGWLMILSGYSAAWTAPGETAFRMMVGWNIEIILMFFVLGLVYYHSLTEKRDLKIFGITERWAMAIGMTIFCVFIECLLNIGGVLVWDWALWSCSFAGIWLILLIGYFPFFASCAVIINLKTTKKKIIMLSIIYAVPVVMNIIGGGILGWTY